MSEKQGGEEERVEINGKMDVNGKANRKTKANGKEQKQKSKKRKIVIESEEDDDDIILVRPARHKRVKSEDIEIIDLQKTETGINTKETNEAKVKRKYNATNTDGDMAGIKGKKRKLVQV